MRRRQPLPRLWLMTDERQSEALWPALARLPRGAGIVFRHYGLAPRERRALFDRVRAIARRRRLVLLLAGPPRQAAAWGAHGSHGILTGRMPGRRLTASAHDPAEMRRAEAAGADLLFVSPVFATRSHPERRPLGRLRFALLARRARRPVIALGGMTARRARSLRSIGLGGWAAIDAWAPRAEDQKRKAVPM